MSFQEAVQYLRRFWVVVVVCVVGAMVGALWSLQRDSGQVARSTVLVQSPSPFAAQAALERMNTLAILGNSSLVLNPAATQLGLDPALLADNVETRAESGTSVVVIEARQPDADQAERLAVAVTDSYLHQMAALEQHAVPDYQLTFSVLQAPTGTAERAGLPPWAWVLIGATTGLVLALVATLSFAAHRDSRKR